MATLEQLRPNLLSLPPEESIIVFAKYYHSREEDIKKYNSQPKPTRRTSKPRKKQSIEAKIAKKLNIPEETVKALPPDQLTALAKLI